MSPSSKPNKPVDIYVRVSQTRGREGDSFQSPDQQEDRCRAQLVADGLQAGQVFTDLDQSGGSASRPQFDLAMQRVRDGASGGIIVYDLSRFGRNTKNVLDGIDEIEAHGAVFISCNEKLDTSTPSGRFVLTLFAALRQMELEQLKERISLSQREAVARGVHISRHVPPGYLKRLDGILEPDPVHGPTITQAFDMAANGVPYAEIAAFLTEKSLPSGGNAAVWYSNRIRRILENRVYTGQARYGKVVRDDAHTPLVSLEMFARAQRKPGKTLTTSATTLLAGICRCAACTYALKGSHSPSRVSTYECRHGNRPGENCSTPVAVSMKRLDDYVLEQFLSQWTRSEPVDRKGADAAASLDAVAAAQKELAEVEELRATLRPAAYAAALDDALARLEEAEAAVPKGKGFSWDGWEEQTIEGLQLEVGSGDSLREMIADNQLGLVRKFLADAIQAVFVKPAASRNPNLPIGDRVEIVWADEPTLELPKRGKRFEPKPLTGVG